MRFQFYLEKLHNSEEYNNFISEKPKSYLCSCFFILDKENRETPDNKQHFDYYVPETKETISFKIEEACKIFPCQPYQDIPEKIDDSLDFDFEGVEEMIQNEMNKKSISNKIQKILFSVQSKEGKAFFLGTVFISGFGMIKVNINLTDMEITDFEKSSFFDILKKVK